MFLDQDPLFDPDIPNYLVRAQQNPTISFHGQDVECYFLGWSGTNVDFEYPNQTETGVVFQASDALAMAKYKGHLATNNPGAVASNSQRKLLFDGTYYHLVYEDGGHIYYTESVNGVDWTAEVKLSNDLFINKGASISLIAQTGTYETICVVWQHGPQINLRKRSLSGEWGEIVLFDLLNSESYDAAPVIDNGNDSHYYIVWRDALNSQGSECDFKIRAYNWDTGEFGTKYQILEMNSYSINPSMISDGHGYLHLVWQENGKIYYSQIHPWNGVVLPTNYHINKESVSEATAWTTHKYPSISLTDNYYPNVMWQAHHNALEVDLVNHRRRNLEGWENTTTFLGKDENYLKPSVTGFPEIQENFELRSAWRSEAMGLYVAKFTGSSWIPYFISNPYSFDPNLSVNKSTTENCRMVYRNYNSLPYLLDVTSQYLEDDPEEESLSKSTDTLTMIHHRKGVIKSAESEIAFELGRVKVDGRDIEFLPLGDSLVVGQHINLKQVFRTNPFLISDHSQLEFSFGSMVINRGNLLAITLPGKDIEFSVNIVDAQTGQIIHNLDNWSAIQNLPSNTLLSRTFTFNIKGIKDVFLNVDLNLSKGISAVESLVEVYYIIKDTLLSKPSVPGNGITATSQIPTKYELYQNYPNPYNPETTISFDLPKECNVALRIFNTLGEHVNTLVSKRLPAGTHQYRWNSRALASGIYIYRLEAEGFVQTRKMVLMK